MGGRLLAFFALVLASCGDVTRDTPLDASLGGAGHTAGAGGAPLGGAGAGGAGLPGGGGSKNGGSAGLGSAGSKNGGSAGVTGGAGTAGGAAGTFGGGGSGGTKSCTYSGGCPPSEYCAVGFIGYPGCGSTGTCEARPDSCPGDCYFACSCGGESCSICISRMFGHDAIPMGSYCMSDGGGPNTMDAGLGQPCGFYNGVCAPGLKCCYPCKVGGCKATCITPEANGLCPTVTPG